MIIIKNYIYYIYTYLSTINLVILVINQLRQLRLSPCTTLNPQDLHKVTI